MPKARVPVVVDEPDGSAVRGSRGLPRGRAGLPPEASAFLQRARVLDATARIVAARGYAATTVQEIVERAGVSRRTFYALFDGKSDAVRSGFDAAARLGLPQIVAAIRAESGPSRAVGAALTTYLTLLDCDRDWADLCVIGVPEAGGAATERREAALVELVDVLAREPGQRPAVLGAVLAVDSEVRWLLSDRDRPLVAARDRLWGLALCAFAGHGGTAGAVESAPTVASLRPSQAGAVIAALASPEDDRWAELGRLIDGAVDAGDGPALWHAVLEFRERRTHGLAVDHGLERRALDGLGRATFFGLPLTDLAEGRSGALMPPSIRDRCLAFVAVHPGSSAGDVSRGIGAVHRSTVDRQLAWLERAGLIRRGTGLGRAAAWRVTPAGDAVLRGD
ncbi:MAG: helix-turn-helix domain-containing protein [Patulibacter sp.]